MKENSLKEEKCLSHITALISEESLERSEGVTMLEWYLLACSSLIDHSACFLMQQKTAAQSMLHPEQAEKYHINYKTKFDLNTYSQVNLIGVIPSYKLLLPRMTPVYVKLLKTNHQGRGNFEVRLGQLEGEICVIFHCIHL